MNSGFVFRGDPTQGRSVTIADVQRPYDDELTFFLVKMDTGDMTAVCSVESLGGDGGFDADAGESEGIVERRETARLSGFLQQLGLGGLWNGNRTWRSLAGELVVCASVDRRGHVGLQFEIAPQPGDAGWAARATLLYDLGDLAVLGDQLHAWFKDQID